MRRKKRVTTSKPLTAAPIKDMAKITTTPTDGKAESGEVRAHAHPLPAPNSAVAAKEKLAMRLAKPEVLNCPRPAESDNDGSRESYHPRRLKEDKEMMAIFEISDSGSDASDAHALSPEIQEQEEYCDEIVDASEAMSDDNELMPLIAHPGKEPAMDRNEWNGGSL
eukprot:2576163-Pyramimonas_sp.AAC.1